MSNPSISLQPFDLDNQDHKRGVSGLILPFKPDFNLLQTNPVATAVTNAVLSNFKSDTNNDKNFVDYLILGALSVFIHTAIVDRFDAGFDQPTLIEPPKPNRVEITIMKPQPKPITLPPPPQVKAQPPKPKVVPLKKPDKPKIKPKPVEQVVEQPIPQPTTVSESAPVSTTPAPPAPVVEKVTQPRAGANYLNNPPPVYPEIAMDRGWQGKVLMKVHVLPSGKPDSVSVQKSSGKKVLDDEAARTVKKWSFVPAMRGTTPIAGWVTVPITFKL